jgi:hypothetical protein
MCLGRPYFFGVDFGGYSQKEQFACSLWGDNGIYDL